MGQRPLKRRKLDAPETPSASTSKSVEPVKPEDSTSNQNVAKDKKREEQLEKFLALMGPRPNTKGWDNEDLDQAQAITSKAKGKQKAKDEQPSPAPENLSDMEWMQRRMKTTLLDGSGSNFADGRVFEQSDDEDENVNPMPIASNKPPDQVSGVYSQVYAWTLIGNTLSR